MSRAERNLIWIAIIFTLSIATAAFYIGVSIGSNQNYTFSFNAAEALICVLSILVTVVLGWQIVSSIRMEDRVRLLDEELKKSQQAFADNQEEMALLAEKFDHYYYSSINSTQALFRFPDDVSKSYANTYTHLAVSLSHLIFLGEEKKGAIRSSLKIMEKCLTELENSNKKFSATQYDKIERANSVIIKAASNMTEEDAVKYFILNDKRKSLKPE